MSLLDCGLCGSDYVLEARSRRLCCIGMTMLARFIAARSSQRAHGRLASIALSIQDAFSLASLRPVRVLPLDGPGDVLVHPHELVTGHLFFEPFWKFVRHSVEEILFVVRQIIGMLVEILLSARDVLLDIVLRRASAPVAEESTSSHLDEYMVDFTLKEHGPSRTKSIALFAIRPSMYSFVVDGVGHVLDDGALQVVSQIPSGVSLADRRLLRQCLSRQLQIALQWH